MSKYILTLLLALGGLLPRLTAQIQLSSERLVEGQKVHIKLQEPAGQLVITYRPNSAVVHRDTLFADPPATSFVWAPDRAGVVALRVPGRSALNVSVRFKGISGSGIAVMAIAAGLLFGGATFAFRLLFKDEEEDGTLDIDLDHMPDT